MTRILDLLQSHSVYIAKSSIQSAYKNLVLGWLSEAEALESGCSSWHQVSLHLYFAGQMSINKQQYSMSHCVLSSIQSHAIWKSGSENSQRDAAVCGCSWPWVEQKRTTGGTHWIYQQVGGTLKSEQ